MFDNLSEIMGMSFLSVFFAKIASFLVEVDISKVGERCIESDQIQYVEFFTIIKVYIGGVSLTFCYFCQ